MCKFNPKNDSRRIDPCLRELMKSLDIFLVKGLEIKACCCGHNKYPMSIVIKNLNNGVIWDLVSDIEIPRKRKFYKKDKQGYYYIPEVEAKK